MSLLENYSNRKIKPCFFIVLYLFFIETLVLHGWKLKCWNILTHLPTPKFPNALSHAMLFVVRETCSWLNVFRGIWKLQYLVLKQSPLHPPTIYSFPHHLVPKSSLDYLNELLVTFFSPLYSQNLYVSCLFRCLRFLYCHSWYLLLRLNVFRQDQLNYLSCFL